MQRRRRFIPGLGFDSLEPRAMLDGDTTMEEDVAAIAQMMADLGSPPDNEPHIELASNYGSRQPLIDVIEQVRTWVNQAYDDEIQAERNHITMLNQWKAEMDRRTSSWPAGWRDGPLYTIPMLQMLEYYRTADQWIADSNAEIQRLQSRKAGANAALDLLIDTMWETYEFTGEYDANGQEIVYHWWNHNSLYT